MPFNDNLPAENTNPWYSPLAAAWANLKTFVNGLETSVNNKVNTATYTSGMAGKLDTAQKGAANGVASLGADSKLTPSQVPALEEKMDTEVPARFWGSFTAAAAPTPPDDGNVHFGFLVPE